MHNMLTYLPQIAHEFTFKFIDSGEVYTWGWKECIPSGKVFSDPSAGGNLEKAIFERPSSNLMEQGSFCLLRY